MIDRNPANVSQYGWRSWSVGCLLIAIVGSARWWLDWYAGGESWSYAERVLVLLVLVIALGHAVADGWREENGTSGPTVRVDRCLWLAWLLLAIAVWPQAFDPERFSLGTLLVAGSLAIFPIAVWQSTHGAGGDARWWTRAGRLAVVGGLIWFSWSAVVYLAAARTSVGSVDYFYYLCAARDMLDPHATVSDNAYCYFPGVYLFWRNVMSLVGSQLDRMQFAALSLLVLNAVAVFLVALRITCQPLLCWWASLWYLVAGVRYEGLSGVTEPLSTLPVLLALALWGGGALQGKGRWRRSVGLGLGIGLAVLVKQQGGLLALGAVALVIGRGANVPRRPGDWLNIAAVPMVAAVVLTLGVLSEGRGWVPLERGLQMAAAYGSEGSLWHNLYVQIRADESLFLAIGLAACIWWFVGRRRPSAAESSDAPWDDTRRRLINFCVIAFLATLIQFRSRPFGHYMLLGLPFAISATTGLWYGFCRSVMRRQRRSQLLRSLWVVVAMMPLAATAGRTDTLYVWRRRPPVRLLAARAWHCRDDLQRDLHRLQRTIRPGQPIFVAPARRNSIYYLLQCRAANPEGYWFFWPDLDKMPWDGCRYVILLTRGLDEQDDRFCTPADRRQLRRTMQRRGFLPLPGPFLTLEAWRAPDQPVEPLLPGPQSNAR